MSDTPATLDTPVDAAPDAVASETIGPVCGKCDGPLPCEQTPVCPHCGWYASLGIHVEGLCEYSDQELGAALGESSPTASPSHLEVWKNLIPLWAWMLMGTAAAIALGSVAVRVNYPEVGGMRTTWAVSQLLGGLALALVCHIVAFLMVSIGDPDMGIADILVSPLKAWKKLFTQLPRRFSLVNTASASLVSSACAAGIIGGIPYENMLDWGFDAPVQKSLLGAVMERASAAGGPEMSMEDAISSFAGDAAGERDLDDYPDPNKAKPAAAVARKQIDALILGYETDAKGRVAKLLLATERKSKLVYSGRVAPSLNDEALAELTAKLRANRAPRPIINVPTTEATWVHPRLTCRVSYERRVESGVLTSLLWEKMLGEMKLPW